MNLNELCSCVSEMIVGRPYHEQRHNLQEDSGLIGLLHLSASIVKHNPPYKNSTEGYNFLMEVFNTLFALPSPDKRYLPKCKTQASRTAAFDLMVEMGKGSIDNYSLLHKKLLQQHSKGTEIVNILFNYYSCTIESDPPSSVPLPPSRPLPIIFVTV